MIDRPPQLDHIAIQLHVHLIELPPPVAEAPHATDPLPTYVGCEHRGEPVPPVPHPFMADVDAALEQQVLNIPEAEREAQIHHHHEADHPGDELK